MERHALLLPRFIYNKSVAKKTTFISPHCLFKAVKWWSARRFFATSRRLRARRLAAVHYYLTHLLFVKSFNRFVSYCRTRSFISAAETILSSTTWHAYFLLKVLTGLSVTIVHAYLSLLPKTILSSTTWHAHFLLKVLTILSGTIVHAYLSLMAKTILSSTTWHGYFLLKVLTILSGTTWQDYFW